jgi:hypothetical protein
VPFLECARVHHPPVRQPVRTAERPQTAGFARLGPEVLERALGPTRGSEAPCGSSVRSRRNFERAGSNSPAAGRPWAASAGSARAGRSAGQQVCGGWEAGGPCVEQSELDPGRKARRKNIRVGNTGRQRRARRFPSARSSRQRLPPRRPACSTSLKAQSSDGVAVRRPFSLPEGDNPCRGCLAMTASRFAAYWGP